jgi:hypothetical protein
LLDISKQNKQKELLLQEERVARQIADSIKKAEMDSMKIAIADSIRKAALDSVKNIQAATSQKPASSGTIAEKSPPKSLSRSIHWAGSSDAIGDVMYEKLASAGIKKTKCSDNGIVAKLNKAVCKTDNLAKVICTYSPKITLTDCNGKLITILETPENFKTSPQANENAAKEELANELRSLNFNAWALAIKRL